MATNFPTSLDTLTNPSSSDSLNSPSHSAQHANSNDAIEALQAKVGADSSAVTTSLDYKVAQLEARAGANLVYNGAMQVAQRGTSETGITSSGYYTADRWRLSLSSLGTWTQTEESDAPTGSGFSKSTKLLCTTADGSPAAGDAFAFVQSLEGQDLQRIKKGTASAEQLTLSFWVKSNTTGTYIAELVDTDNDRSVSASYSVSASGTWEKKTITYPADAVGALDNDNGTSLELLLWLGSGSNFTSGTLQTSWDSKTGTDRAVGQTNLAAATNNYWQITGVQLEVGPVATAFDHLPFGVELARCQRYFERFASNTNDDCFATGVAFSTTAPLISLLWQTEKRANASVSFDGTWEVVDGGAVRTLTSPSVSNVNKKSAQVSGTVTGMTAGQAVVLRAGTTTSHIDISAEL
jgi:hypothetical protein